MSRARQRRLYLLRARPAASLVVLAASVALEAAGRGPGTAFTVLIAASLVVAGTYALATRSLGDDAVLGASLVFDTAIVAVASLLLDREALFALGYFWIVGATAFLLGARDTVLLTGLSVAALVGVHLAPGEGPDVVTVALGATVLGLVGGVLAALARGFEHAELDLARDRVLDATALRISERVRATLDLDAVLAHVVEELGPALGLMRCLIRTASAEAVRQPVHEWVREGVRPIGGELPPLLARVLEARRPLVVASPEEADGEAQEFLEQEGVVAFLAYPVVWHDVPLAVVSFHDDRPRDWSAEALPLLERLVAPIGAALVQADAFARQQSTLRRLEDVSRLREELVASVSHELRTPLTSTIGFLRTLERTDIQIDEEHRRLFVSTARREAERLARLVDDLLELTRLERGPVALHRAPADVAEIVEHAVRSVTPPEGRPVEVELNGGLTAEVDADRLLQVFTNLLDNSFRHGSGKVVVSGVGSPGRLSVEVSDEGEAIPADRVAQLFVPFARWGSSRESTGLGLAISRRIVEAHGGSLAYRAPAEGRPHAFVVSLPR